MANARLTQEAVEVLVAPAASVNARLTQEAVEVLVQLPVVAAGVQLTQEADEWIASPSNQELLTQALFEYSQSPSNAAEMTQEVLEVIMDSVWTPPLKNNYIAIGNRLASSTKRYIV